MAVQRMVEAGAVPGARGDHPVVAQLQAPHGGGSRIGFAREMQLLATPAAEVAAQPAGA
jgi:hypothetical protein